MKNIAIIDYGSGNLRSCAKAFEHVVQDSGFGIRDSGGRVVVTSNPADVKAASHIVLPGVGAFGDCVKGLQSVPGMIEQMQESVMTYKKPFLGICVGMQMLFERGLEHGEYAGLGWLKGEVVKLRGQRSGVRGQEENVSDPRSLIPDLKIPHMGWNELNFKPHPLFKDIPPKAHAYFVHSYHAVCGNENQVIATTEYGGAVTAVVARDNIMGTQFHPEKSQETGLKLIANFLQMS